MQGDFVAKRVTLPGPEAARWFAGDCVPTAQSESEKSIRRERSKKRQINGDFQRFLLMLSDFYLLVKNLG